MFSLCEQNKSNIPAQLFKVGDIKTMSNKVIPSSTAFELLTLVLLNPDIPYFANSVDPDQLASEEAN